MGYIRKQHEIDASGKVLGRLATEIADLLRGKRKVDFVWHEDGGDAVLVSNVDKIKFTGDKMQQKIYRTHSGYPGGLKNKTLTRKMEEDPAQVLRAAVYNMLPKNKLREGIIKRLTFTK